MANQAPQLSPQQQNILNRNIILQNAVEMRQQTYGQTLTGTIPGQVVNIPLRNVGLLKRLYVEIIFNLAQSAAETFTRTAQGPACVLSQVAFTDLSNQTRIQTTGWHLHHLATMRRANAFGAAFTNDSPVGIGSNFGVIKAPASVTTIQQIRMYYEVPLAYSDVDLRGAIYANVVNATMNLQLTVNPNLVAATGANSIQSVYSSSTASLGTITAFTVNVYQIYLDQLPMTQRGPVLPILDLSTAYTLNNTAISGLAVNQDNPISYANFRDFLSTTLIYDNNGAVNAGTDINYFALQSANYTNIWKNNPFVTALEARNSIGDDPPLGTYYFQSRGKPVSTIQYGNMQLIVNPSTVTSATGSQLLIGFEAMMLINMATSAGSLAAG
jgi:hypothetical protein